MVKSYKKADYFE